MEEITKNPARVKDICSRTDGGFYPINEILVNGGL